MGWMLAILAVVQALFLAGALRMRPERFRGLAPEAFLRKRRLAVASASVYFASLALSGAVVTGFAAFAGSDPASAIRLPEFRYAQGAALLVVLGGIVGSLILWCRSVSIR